MDLYFSRRRRHTGCALVTGVQTCALPIWATTVFGILGMVEGWDMNTMGKDNPMSWHLLAEAMQLSYADRDAYLGDGDFVDVPAQGVLDKASLAARRQIISPYRPAGRSEPGTPPGSTPAHPQTPPPNQRNHHFLLDVPAPQQT